MDLDVAPSKIRNRDKGAADPEQPVFNAFTMDEIVDRSLSQRRLNAVLVGVFAAVSLLLAAIGIYGVISYWVGSRTRDIGIRIALGADRASIVRLIAREFGVVIGAGLLAGLVAAFGLTRLMASMLFGVSATDVLTFASIPLVLGVVAIVATLVPARRAASVDPLSAIRNA
jgi:ABC-type antimicrobial peptide transport system permease subunit